MRDYLLKSQIYWAWILLPMMNILAWFMADPLYENMTHIAYAKQHFCFVLLWAVSCALYLWCYTRILMKQLHINKKSVLFILTLSCLLMVISICIPYHENTSNMAHLHVNLAILATATYIILFLFLLCRTIYQKPLLWQRIITPYLCIITLLLLLLLLMGHVSTLLETLFVICMGIYHWWIQCIIHAQ